MRRAFSRIDEICIVAGGWLIPSALLTPILRRDKLTLFWSESNDKSTRRKGIVSSIARKFAVSRFDGYCVPNRRATEWLRFYIPEFKKKLRISLPNLVDESLYSGAGYNRRKNKEALRKKFNLGAKEKVLLCPVRLMERKGIEAFLEAIKGMALPDVVVLVAGDGPDRKRLENLTASMSDIEVRILGFCPTEKMLELYALSDVFLLPSFEDPNPLSVIEACHAALPLLLSRRLGNYPEVFREGQNGWSFDPSDAESIQRALNRCLAAPDSILMRMGKFSSEIARNKFATDTVIGGLITSLEDSLRDKPGYLGPTIMSRANCLRNISCRETGVFKN
jgi:glycosyltransferase involved in cell wall biosynthesis